MQNLRIRTLGHTGGIHNIVYFVLNRLTTDFTLS